MFPRISNDGNGKWKCIWPLLAHRSKDAKVQTAIILNCTGPHVLEVYDNVVWENADDKNKPDKVLEALEKYCNPRDNEALE